MRIILLIIALALCEAIPASAQKKLPGEMDKCDPYMTAQGGYGYLAENGPKAAVWWAEGIYKVIASHPDLTPEELALAVGEGPADVYYTVADKKLLQFMSRTATKWGGIKQMLAAAGIPAEQAIYFGDDHDDIEPIVQCGLGIAVANALPQVKARADDITDSNDEDGVAAYLRRLEDGAFAR